MNHCVVITGCSSGIGRATAIYFQNQGWNVVATMRSPDKETELTSYPNVLVDYLDLTSQESIDHAIENALQRFERIDVLVNNAGIGAWAVFEEVDEAVIRDSFETNVFGTMRVTRALLPHFRENKKGTIIFVSSTMPQLGAPLSILYCSTKMAVEGFGHALYYELFPLGIRVKIVQPGSTRTNIAMQREFLDSPKIEDYSPICDEFFRRFQHRYETETVASPEEPAKVIYKAAIDKSQRFRYYSGRDAKLMGFLKRLFPEHTLKNLVSRIFGINTLASSVGTR
jgi:NAD(P)-dependent dehydrogenase (short-subunit alcohol dehydrogenase family)